MTPPPVRARDVINSKGDPTIELLISDVDGHGRAIEAVAEKVDEGDIPVELEVFMSALRDRLEEKYPSLKQPPSCILKAICAVVTGKVVELKTKLDESTTVEDILQIGLFSLQPVDGGYVLHCPYILLWLFAKNSTIAELQQLDFCTYEEQGGRLERNQRQHWQHFVNLFHVVKSYIFEEGEHSISEFHRGAIFHKEDTDLKVHRRCLKLLYASNQFSTKSGNTFTHFVLL